MNLSDLSEKRSESRFSSENPIAYAFLNNAEHYVGIAKDVSRDGMFFLTSRRLKPGTIIRIQPLDCQAPPLLWGNGSSRQLAASLCVESTASNACRKDFANLVTAQIKRCERVDETTAWRYGVGVNFVRPSV